MAARRQRRAVRPRQRARKGAPLHRFGPRGRNRAPWTASAPLWRRKQQGLPRHPSRVASRWNSFWRRRSATLETPQGDESRRGRCVGVSAANVWARDPDVCAPMRAFLGGRGHVTASRRVACRPCTLQCGSAAPRGRSRVASLARYWISARGQPAGNGWSEPDAREPVLRDGSTRRPLPAAADGRHFGARGTSAARVWSFSPRRELRPPLAQLASSEVPGSAATRWSNRGHGGFGAL